MITVSKPAMSPMVKAALKEIEAKGGIWEPEDVLWLQDAARRCVNPHCTRDIPALIDCPVYIGGVWLHPLRRGCVEWLKSIYGDKWAENVFAIAFAMAYADQPEYLKTLAGLEAKLTVWAWSKKLNCSESAIDDAVSYMLNPYSDIQVTFASRLQNQNHIDSDPFDWGDVLCGLCHFYQGTTPDYWLWNCSQEFTTMMYDKAAKSMPQLSKDKVDPAKFEALSEFRAIVLNIIERAKT